MTIKKKNKYLYCDNWKEISHEVRFVRAEGRCECTGECGRPHYTDGAITNMRRDEIEPEKRCEAEHGYSHPVTGSKVVLTVAHLDHNIENNDPDNHKAMCQYCRLAYDKENYMGIAAITRRQKAIDAGQIELL